MQPRGCTDNVLARQFGIVFALSNELRPLYAGFGINCRDYNGADGVILERDLEIDYRQRLEPDIALAWVRRHANANQKLAQSR